LHHLSKEESTYHPEFEIKAHGNAALPHVTQIFLPRPPTPKVAVLSDVIDAVHLNNHNSPQPTTFESCNGKLGFESGQSRWFRGA
jgi:hypothetical protein